MLTNPPTSASAVSATIDPPRCSEPTPASRGWYIASRWEEYTGEAQANIARIILVAVLYAIQLGHYHALTDPLPHDTRFHRLATLVAVGSTLSALLVLLCLRRGLFTAGLKYVSTTTDVVALIFLAALGTGPESPLVLGLFVAIALSGLRFNPRLTAFTTILSAVAYLGLVGMRDAHWFDGDHATPVATQGTTLCCLLATGASITLMCQRLRRMAEYYAQRLLLAAQRSSQ